MSVVPLHRDEVDGCIVLIRMPGDCWNVARDQADCDFIRSTEVQSPGKTRFGLAGYRADIHCEEMELIPVGIRGDMYRLQGPVRTHLADKLRRALDQPQQEGDKSWPPFHIQGEGENG